jgi:Sec-independent protein translocase protein TatA
MGGFHMLDIIIVAAIALALFGPKALQSMARSAGKGVAQAKDMKDKLMSDIPVEDITKITDSIPQVPLNPRQAVGMLLASDTSKEKEAKAAPKKVEEEKTQETKANEA